MLTRGTSIKRWNNFPRIEYITHLDNVGFILHISLFLAHIEEKETGVNIDREFLIKKIIFDSFKWLILADINAGTRDYIIRISREIFTQVENKWLEKILGLDAPEYIKTDIETVIKKNEICIENTIIAAAKKYAGYMEAATNHKVYDVIYELPLSQIQDSLNVLKDELKSLHILLENISYQKYLSHIRRLSHAMRWSGESKMLPISVMAHLVEVTFISYIIGMIENYHGNTVNTLELMKRAIYHDIPEAITWDIINPTKRSVDGFAEVLEQVEREMLDDYLFCHAPNEFKESLETYIFTPFEGEEGKLVKHADILAALFEAKIEMLFGNNREFEEIFWKLSKMLVNVEIPSINYLLKNGLASFSDKNAIT